MNPSYSMCAVSNVGYPGSPPPGQFHPGSQRLNASLPAPSMFHAYLDKLPREIRELKIENCNPHQTPVLIVYNLSPADISLDKLFNLFSLYGTVSRIKIMREKVDSALIQYSDAFYATLAYNCLQGATMFGRDIQIRFSRNTEVKLPPSISSDSQEDVKRTRAFQLKDQLTDKGMKSKST